MLRYNKSNIKELKEFLFNSHVHDAKLENVRFDCREDRVIIELCNPIFEDKIALTLCNIGVALATKGGWPGDRETIYSLTVEEDLSYLQRYLEKNGKDMENGLYLLFQMFSGDEWHIIAKEILVETK